MAQIWTNHLVTLKEASRRNEESWVWQRRRTRSSLLRGLSNRLPETPFNKRLFRFTKKLFRFTKQSSFLLNAVIVIPGLFSLENWQFPTPFILSFQQKTKKLFGKNCQWQDSNIGPLMLLENTWPKHYPRPISSLLW